MEQPIAKDASAVVGFNAGPGHTDIVAPSWFGWLPEAWTPYLLLARMDRPIGTWLLYLPSLWGILLGRPGWQQAMHLAVLFGIGAIAMRGAGCVINDMWDRDIDRNVPRTAARPLACGMLSMWQAWFFLVGLLLIGLVVLLQLPLLCWGLGVASLLPVALYPAAKRVTDWPQVVLGFTFGFGAPMGYAAAQNHLGPVFWSVYAAAIFWVLSYDTIYAHQDRQADAMLGLGSSALSLGHATLPFIAICDIGVIAALAAAGYFSEMPLMFYPALLPAAALLAWQAKQLDINDPLSCLRLFKFSREIGFAVVLACLTSLL